MRESLQAVRGMNDLLPAQAARYRRLAADLAVLSLSPESWSSLRDELVVAMDDAVSALANLGS